MATNDTSTSTPTQLPLFPEAAQARPIRRRTNPLPLPAPVPSAPVTDVEDTVDARVAQYLADQEAYLSNVDPEELMAYHSGDPARIRAFEAMRAERHREFWADHVDDWAAEVAEG